MKNLNFKFIYIKWLFRKKFFTCFVLNKNDKGELWVENQANKTNASKESPAPLLAGVDIYIIKIFDVINI